MNSRIFLAIVALFCLLPLAAHAVQFGWQALPDGGIEYLVQVEPELLDAFRQDGFSSDVPANLQRDLRRIRITVGNKKLPNEGDVNGPKPISQGPSAGPTAAGGSNSPPAGQTSSDQLKSVLATSPPNSPAAIPQPEEAAQSTSGTLNLPPPPDGKAPEAVRQSQAEAEPPPATSAEPPRPLSSLPFFKSGQVTKLDGGRSSNESQTSTPRLGENEAAPEGSTHTFGSDQLSMTAKPAVLETPVGSSSALKSAPLPKPWFALMGALLALFASLGANVYLAWIHQSVRMKYRALVTQMGGSMART